MTPRYTVVSMCVVLALSLIVFSVPEIPTIKYSHFKERVSGDISDSQEETRVDTIYFFGDVMLARDVERTMLRSGADFPFAGFVIPKNSYAVANFESAVPVIHVPTPNNTFRFSTPVSSLKALTAAGFTHVGLANNHTFDFGLPGYNQTVTALWDSGLIPFGHPSVLATPSYTIIETKETTVGILGIHTLYGTPTFETIAVIMRELQTKSDIQVAYVHWGDEYVEKPNLAQRNFAKQLTEAGVDIIIGHHPHVVQSIEMIDETPVFYSLGNFIFDQYFSLNVQQGLVLKLTLAEENTIELIPVTSLLTRNQPTVMKELDKAAFLEYVATISAGEYRDNILQGSLTLSPQLASSTEVVIMAQ